MVGDSAHAKSDARLLARGGQATGDDATHVLQAEANKLRTKDVLVRVEVKDDDTLSSLGRSLYLKHMHRMPEPLELKAFVEDASRRNGLVTKDQQDHLHPGRQTLTLKIPMAAEAPHRQQGQAAGNKASEHAGTKHQTVASEASGKVHPDRHVASANTVRDGKPNVPQSAKPQDHLAVKPAAEAAPPKVSATERALFPCSGSLAEVTLIANWVTHNEAGHQSFTAYNPNDAGNGVSVGLMQWNQKRGKLPELLEAWHKANPAKFDKMFGSYSDDLLNPSWVRTADFSNSKLSNGLHAALEDNQFQQVQLQIRNHGVERSCEIAKDHSFKSVRGRAVVADLVNQIGEGGTNRILGKVPMGNSESHRIEALKKVTHGRINGVDRVASIEDKVHEIWRKQAQ